MMSMSGLGLLKARERGEQTARLMVARWLVFVQVWSDLLVAVPLKTCCRAGLVLLHHDVDGLLLITLGYLGLCD